MTMLKQNDIKVTKPQNKHGHGRIRKCPIGTSVKNSGWSVIVVQRKEEKDGLTRREEGRIYSS